MPGIGYTQRARASRQRTAPYFIEGRDASSRAHVALTPLPSCPASYAPAHHAPSSSPSTGPPSTGRPWQRHHRRTRHRAAGHGGSPRAMRLSEEPPLSRRSHSATAAGNQAPQKPQCNRCRSSIRLQSSSTLTSIPSTTFSILGRSRLRNVSMRSPSMKLVASWVFRSVRNSRHF